MCKAKNKNFRKKSLFLFKNKIRFSTSTVNTNREIRRMRRTHRKTAEEKFSFYSSDGEKEPEESKTI